MPVSFDDLQANRFQEDLELAAGYKPILKSDLEKAYKRFKPVGVKVGQIRKGMSDARLYRKATQDVIDWHKHNKKKQTEARVNRTMSQTPPPQPPSAQFVQQALAQAGFTGSQPPPYALKSREALIAWINRNLARQAHQP